MTEVRKHKRQTASGKTTTVRHHTRRGGDGKDDGAQARAAWQDRAAPHYSTLPPSAPPTADESFWDEDSQEPDGEWWADDDEAQVFTGPVAFGGGHAVDGDLDITEDWAGDDGAQWVQVDDPGGMPPGVTFAEGITFEPGAVVAFGGPAAGRSVNYRNAEPGPQRRGDRAFPKMQEEMRAWRSRPAPETGPVVPDTSPLGRALGTDTQEGAEHFARLKAYREAGYNGPLDSDNRIPDPDDPANYESLHALAAMSE